MLKFWGKILKKEKILRAETFVSNKEQMSDALLECLEFFAAKFNMEAPMWHSQHTKQMGLFHKAVFKPDDFIDKVDFDKFEIQILSD